MKLSISGLNKAMLEHGTTMKNVRKEYGASIYAILKHETLTLDSARKIAEIIGCNVCDITESSYKSKLQERKVG